MPVQPVLTLFLGDLVRLRRTHPCGGDTWLVDRLGADIGLRCRTCGRHVLLERRTLERRLAGFESRGDPAMTAAVSGGGSLGRGRATDGGPALDHGQVIDDRGRTADRGPAVDDGPAINDRAPATDDGPAA